MKSSTATLGAIAASFVFLFPLAGHTTTQSELRPLDTSALEFVQPTPDQHNATFAAPGNKTHIARNSNGRRCRWVKGKGLVCDGGAFGTFTL